MLNCVESQFRRMLTEFGYTPVCHQRTDDNLHYGIREVDNAVIILRYDPTTQQVHFNFQQVNEFPYVFDIDRQEYIYPPSGIIVNDSYNLDQFASYFKTYFRYVRGVNIELIKEQEKVKELIIMEEYYNNLPIVYDVKQHKDLPTTRTFRFEDGRKFGYEISSFCPTEVVLHLRLSPGNAQKVMELLKTF